MTVQHWLLAKELRNFQTAVSFSRGGGGGGVGLPVPAPTDTLVK